MPRSPPARLWESRWSRRRSCSARPGPHRSIMAGLNCGTPSLLAWPTLRAGLTGSLVIDDALAETAMVLLAEDGVAAGETGAAAAAALLALADEPEVRGRLGLDHESRVVLLCTEGATDPDGYQRVVGRAPDEVDAAAFSAAARRRGRRTG
ncbi:pyridoxal-phosphate dependent enzyme [Nocardioides pelophilus]|uniref:pyridoxal-phosphate dependent enzyme n=1 Tax=Nocardioides pelophilus TaxID=2172019 RepID=UPI0028A9BBE0|nr:pyridoxal-phosphate dependent enzyme [Nocardioides pelophilus]